MLGVESDRFYFDKAEPGCGADYGAADLSDLESPALTSINPPQHWFVIAYTMSPTKRLNDSFSTNCLYTCVSSFKRCCITLASA